MKSNRKRTKVARTTATTTSDEMGEDRLSSLPDAVLCHILSFLPTKYAATTSALSTRWKSLFLGVPKIELDESLLMEPQELEDDRIYDNQNFINFVNRRLILCQTSSISEFRLNCQELPEAPVINLWLSTLLLRKVQVLEIQVQSSDSPHLRLPREIFQSETLVVLKLCGPKVVFKSPEFVCFPKLKVLHLRYLDMQFESNDFRIAEGYSLLEDLRLEEIRFQKNKDGDDAILGISMPTLRKLAIIGVAEKLGRINIDAPHLQHLECMVSVRKCASPKVEITLYKCKSLESADLYISPFPFALLNQCSQWIIDLLRDVNNVKELHLSGHGFSQVFMVIALAQPGLPVRSLPQFPNLTHLVLTVRSAWVLLESTPNLIVLVCNTMAYLLIWAEGHDGKSLPPENEPRCLAQTLREIRVRLLREIPVEFETMRFLLQKGAVLEKMIIERPRDKIDEWSSSTWKQLRMLERGSQKCKILLI